MATRWTLLPDPAARSDCRSRRNLVFGALCSGSSSKLSEEPRRERRDCGYDLLVNDY